MGAASFSWHPYCNVKTHLRTFLTCLWLLSGRPPLGQPTCHELGYTVCQWQPWSVLCVSEPLQSDLLQLTLSATTDDKGQLVTFWPVNVKSWVATAAAQSGRGSFIVA
jgi:hypothetical protein